ncbi:MAG: PfaD family polyunsaturated fatty acid/polyketide biosynthesis protein [Proteobacteria bacterium]|nr:PfaD family polyunsaturated fatty acid/polyketide biosynthesis protein [Pseudomonadota bacterium]
MTSEKNTIKYTGSSDTLDQVWIGDKSTVAFDEEEIKSKLLNLDKPCYMVRDGQNIGLSDEGRLVDAENRGKDAPQALSVVPPLPVGNLGSSEFNRFYGTKYAYYGGSMANAISSEEMVIALGRAGFLASFGAGHLIPSQIEAAIDRIQGALPDGPYAFNLIHAPVEEALERGAVDLYLKRGVTIIEASAYPDLTPYVVHYRVAGLELDAQNRIQIKNRVIAKLSRREVAAKFMEPAPDKFLGPLLDQGLITETQVQLAKKVPMADDVTVEADSGGHTDNRPLVGLLPSIIALRNEIQEKRQYERPIGVGAAGGIGTPESTLAAFMMGADFVVTGSVNQACIEAGCSDHTKNLLAQAEMADVMMSPAADSFEIGGKLQCIKRGTFFPMRAQKLYELYRSYNSIEEIPAKERERLEKQVFRKGLDTVWNETIVFFNQRDPEQIEKAKANPKRKMALIFRWYLGQASNWAVSGEKGREMDYQIWCGPSMGAFNDWVRGSYLEPPDQRKVVDVARHLMTGAAYLYRLQHLKLQQVWFPSHFGRYVPHPL